MNRTVGLLGVPSSAGAYAPGQEKGPQALRAGGLLERLSAAGLEVVDHGDCATWRWQPDRGNPTAQNLDVVVALAKDTATRVRAVLAAGQLPLVLGGDCTIELGVVAGHLPSGDRLGLLYFDLHPDLNTPSSVPDGALDWMGMAHLLAETGAEAKLAEIGPRSPLLSPQDVFLFAYDPAQATAWEREVIARRELRGSPVADVRADPEGTAAAALAWLEPRCDRLLVHFDVDVIDFTDQPLSENTGRNQGLPFAHAMRALRVLLGSRYMSALTITELNPDHGAEDGSTVAIFVAALASAVAASPLLSESSSTAGAHLEGKRK